MPVMESVPELFTPMSRELLEAARLGDTNILGTSIPDVHVTAGRNSTLHIAAKLGHTDFCNKTLDLQPSLLLLKNARGDTPLHIAARAGHHQLVNDLISTSSERRAQGDDRVRSLVQMANNVGNTTLHEAVQNGHQQVVAALMEKSPRVSAVTNVNGVSPLYMAVESGSTSIVRLLLAAADASCDGPKGQTALHLAVLRSYRSEITRMLLQQRGSLTRKADAAERVPLHFAAARGDLEMVRLLLENDESTACLQDNGGATAIHVAASFGYVNAIKHLIETCPGCVEVMDGEGSNFFHVAISKRREQVVRFVAKLPRPSDLLNEPDSSGNTPLHRAIMSRDMAIIQMLSSNPSVKLSATNNRGQTALDVALSNTRKRLVIKMFKVVIDLTNKGARFSDQQLLEDMRHPVDQKGTVEKKNHKENADSKHAVHTVDQKGKVEEKNYQDIADTLPVVAALITTATFTAAFTLSSSFKRDRSDYGSIYMRIRGIAFVVFLIFDALAMITAICVPFLVIYVRVGTPVTQVNSLTLSEILLQVAFIGFTVAFASGVCVLLADHWLIILIWLVILLFLPILKRRILPYYPYLCWLTRGSEFQIIYARLMIARHRLIRIANYELAIDFIKFPGVWGFSITKF